MPQFGYQNYFLVIKHFNIAEKAIIARVYPNIIILKLRPNNRFNWGF